MQGSPEQVEHELRVFCVVVGSDAAERYSRKHKWKHIASMYSPFRVHGHAQWQQERFCVLAVTVRSIKLDKKRECYPAGTRNLNVVFRWHVFAKFSEAPFSFWLWFLPLAIFGCFGKMYAEKFMIKTSEKLKQHSDC